MIIFSFDLIAWVKLGHIMHLMFIQYKITFLILFFNYCKIDVLFVHGALWGVFTDSFLTLWYKVDVSRV